MKNASLKSKGGFVLNPSTNRYEWNNELDNGTRLIPLLGDDIWFIFSNNVIRRQDSDNPLGEPGEQPYSLIADLFTTDNTAYLLFLDRDHIFTTTTDYTQIYNPDYYTFTIYKQPGFSGPLNTHDAYDLISQYCQVQSAHLNRLKFSPAYIDDEKIVFKANTQLVRTVDDTPEETPPESEIITDADYVIIEYIWTPAAGTDLDTRTQIQSPSGMVHPVVGWHRASNDGAVLLWNNDNTGSGREGILVNIKEYAKSNVNKLTVSLRAFWYNTRGTGDVTLKATAYKGGNMVANSFGWDNYGGTIVSTTMASINVATKQSGDIDGEYVGAFYYDLETKTGRIVTGGTDPNPGSGNNEGTPPVINCIPTVFNITQIQGDATKEGNVIVVASIWYEGVEYPYITTREQMRYVIANVDGSKVGLASGFNTGINIYEKVYNRYPEFCKAIVLARDRTDNFFIAGASMGNLDKYALTPRIWDMRPYERSFKRDTMRPTQVPSQLRLTKLSPEMKQFIKDNHEYGIFFNGNYNVNNLVDMINQGNDITINACIKVESNMFDVPPVEPEPPVVSCTPTSFNVTQIQGAAAKGGYVVVGASIWYKGKEYPYIIIAEPTELPVGDVNRTKLNLGGGFRKGITMYYDAYNAYPEYCKALVIARNTNDNYFIAGVGSNNLETYARTPGIWDGGGPNRIFNPNTMRVVNEPSQIRLTKLSPEMTQFIKTHGGYASSFLNGDYIVNNLVDMINQGNDITINACVEVESNLFPTQPEQPPVVTTPSTPAMAIVNMTSDTPFISTFKNGFELESYYDAQAECYRIENENNKVYLRDPAYAPVVSFRPKQGNLMGAAQIQGEVYDWKGIGFDISLATPRYLNSIQNTYSFPSNDVVLVMFSQLNEGQSAPPVLNGRFVCNPEIE